MTSSLRNSIHRRNHKERSQLAHRSKLGILEKHADYVKRARDYHSKQDRLTRLKQKAAEKNKDEFYFSMRNQRTKGGVHIKDRGNVALPTDIVKVLKTQDENYVRTVRAAGLKKIDKLKNQLTALADLMKPGLQERENHDGNGIGLNEEEYQTLVNAGIISSDTRQPQKNKGPRIPSHIIFVDSEEEAQKHQRARAPALKAEEIDISTQNPDSGWKFSDDQKKSQIKLVAPNPDVTIEEPTNIGAPNRRQLLKELSARLVRDTQLRYAEREFEMQRLLMNKGARKKLKDAQKVEGDDDNEEDEDEVDARRGKRAKPGPQVDEKTYKPRVYKWRLERKR